MQTNDMQGPVDSADRMSQPPNPEPHAVQSQLSRQVRRTIALALTTIAAVYVLILIGGTVRATGAGMGCPDWPLCFGQLIPPTSEAELPPNWREIYSHRGYSDAPFDATKTWTEYLNRLFGVLVGLLVTATTISAASLRKTMPAVFWASLGGFLLVGFNGWVGSQVVATNLRPVMISAHMLGAFFVQMCLIYAVVRAAKPQLSSVAAGLPRWFTGLTVATLLAMVVQIFMGIQIRESVDLISRAADPVERDQWIEMVPFIFYFHRSFSWVILAAVAYQFWRVYRSPLRRTWAGSILKVLVLLVAFEMALGGALNHLGFPMAAQPVHLLAAHLIFGALWFLWCVLKRGPNAAPAGSGSSTHPAASAAIS